MNNMTKTFKQTLWQTIKFFINSVPIDDNFTRQDIMNHCRQVLQSCPASIDTLRRQLSVCGYISEGDGNGTYIKLKQIPIDLTSSDLRKEYNTINKTYEYTKS